MYFGDEKIMATARRVQLYILPVLNPDGLAYIESKENIGNYGDDIVLKRKNGRQFVEAACRPRSQGVDLNRNYNVSWSDTLDVTDLDQFPCGETYRGAYPFSEPETRAMRDFVLAHRDSLKFVVSYHSYGNMLVIPYSGGDPNNVLTPD